MKLRIVSGHLKRRFIKLSGSVAHFRPTKEVVREAVADSLHDKIPGSMIADICAGSGAFGFEMLSRGADSVHFIDNNQGRCRSIVSHARQFDVENHCKIFTTDIRAYLKTCSFLYDIIYYDPPYNNLELIEIIPDVLKFLSKEGMLIFEYEKTNKYSDIFTKNNTGNYQKNIKKFGKTELCFFTRISDSNK
jgi:16S rRNA (guanine966-N2)-methyltransferase